MLKSQKFLIDNIKPFSKFTANLYEQLFKSMSKTEYREWVEKFVRNGVLNIIVGNDPKLNTQKLESAINALGGSIYGKVLVKDNGFEYETPIDFYVVQMDVTILAQTVHKGLAVSDNPAVNEITGQYTRAASKMTAPEEGLLLSIGLKDTLKEILAVRGGDSGLDAAATNKLINTGEYSLKDIEKFKTGIGSTKMMNNYFKSIHISML